MSKISKIESKDFNFDQKIVLQVSKDIVTFSQGSPILVERILDPRWKSSNNEFVIERLNDLPVNFLNFSL